LTAKNSADKFFRGTIARRVLTELRINIILGTYPAGEQLVEERLADELKVSRGSIRTAFQCLEKEGLLKVLPNGRKTVNGFSQKDVVDMYGLRLLLETEAMKTIISGEPVYYSPLIAILDQFAKYQQGENATEDWCDLDVQFHRAIVTMASNRSILMAWETISSLMYTFSQLHSVAGHMENYVGDFYSNHKELLDAVITHDPRCLDVVKEHVLSSQNRTLQLLTQLEGSSGTRCEMGKKAAELSR
jgi:GntR family transcriptional regulator of gluconate operon